MILYGIYAVMTLILVVILKCLGMKVFDAFCIGFGTAGTGGFAVPELPDMEARRLKLCLGFS
jgi:trk system potassium uptake protein TrkH